MEIDDLTYSLLTRRGFEKVFWETLSRLRRVEPDTPRRAVFEMLNNHYQKVLGEPKYPSYDAFRKSLNRNYRKLP